MRVKTMKMRKVISQGLFLNKNSFPEISADAQIGDDLTELLKIVKWEPKGDAEPQPIVKGTRKNFFPRFIRKTDQERIQNYGSIVGRREETFEATVKLDGSSMTAYCVHESSPYFKDALKNKAMLLPFFKRMLFKAKNFFKKPKYVTGVCSRNVHLADNDGSMFYEAAKNEGILYYLSFLSMARGWSIAVQGELVAPSIQDNYEKVDRPEFFCFDIFNIDNQEYLLPYERRDVLKHHLSGVKSAPSIDDGMDLVKRMGGPGDDLVQNILNLAEGPGMNPGVMREGLVFKSNLDRNFSFKAVSNSYLLAKEAKQEDDKP
jgi:RNA ligase (TIGR02306 family)